MNKLARRLLIKGRVQGVGFRWALQDEALRLGLNGWVRNLRDGRVEALVYGDNLSVETLTAWAYRGPPMAYVEEVLCNDEFEDRYDETGFSVLSSR